MDIPFLIRSIIFLTAGLVLLIFPTQILEWQMRWNVRILKLFHRKYDVEKGRREGKKINKVLGILFLVLAVLMFVFAIR